MLLILLGSIFYSDYSYFVKGLLLAVLVLLYFVARFVYKIVIAPILLARFYKKQGIQTCYFKGSDPIKTWDELAIKHGDSLYPWTEFSNKNPDAPAVLINLGPLVRLQLVNPAYIKEFLSKEFELYRKGPMFEIFEVCFGDAIAVVPPEQWKARRRIYSEAFHFDFLKDYLPKIEDQAIRFCNNVHPSKMDSMDIFKLSKYFTGAIASEIFFGQDITDEKIEGETIIKFLTDYCDRTIGLLRSVWVFLFGPKIINRKLTKAHREMVRRRAVFKKACKEIIAKKEEAMKKNERTSAKKIDLLEIFIKAKSDPSTKLTDEGIISEFIGFFFAGTDTTSYLISHACYFIASRPDITKRLRDEISSHWSLGKPLTFDIINKFEYLHAFLKEVHRWVSIAFNTGDRQATKDHKILDLTIQKGTNVVIGFRTMSFNPKFFKNPYEFDPDRFLRKDPEEKFNSDPFTWVPFSAGRANCLGQHVAMAESRVIMAHILMRYDLILPENFEYKLHVGEIGFLVPMQPMLLKLKPRV